MKRFQWFKVFVFYALFNVLIHLFFIQLPPCGTHVWRQCNTLGMSRNFADESMDIFHPRIDRRNETNGITGSHFPLFEWTLAACSKLFGFTDLLARIFSLLVFSIGMLYFYLFLKSADFEHRYALIGPLLLLSIPQNYYDSMNAMPDVMALTLSLAALYYFSQYFKRDSMSFLAFGLVFTILCGLIKFQFLIVPLSSIAFMQFKKTQVIAIGLGLLVTIIPIVFWYSYALELTQLNNLKEFGLWIKPISLQSKIETFKWNLISDFPELILGWPLTVLLLMVLNKMQLKQALAIQVMIGLIGFALFYVLAIERMRQHSYYFMSLLPFLILAVLGLFRNSAYKFNLLILFCCLNFVWSFIRIIPSRWTDGGQGIPKEFKSISQRMALTKALSNQKISLVGADVSGCIFFYFTNTKGYSFENFDELIEPRTDGQLLLKMRQKGLGQILINRTVYLDHELLKLNHIKRIQRIGNFEVWAFTDTLK